MPNSLRLGLGLGRGRSGVGISVSIGAGPFTTGTLLTATVNGLEGGETVTYQWQDDGVNIAGATSSTYTAAIGTDSVADASDIRCQVTVDGGDPINSSAREIRYAAGSVTESALADWTIDDDVLNVNLASDFTTTNLTGSYVITGLPTGAVDDGDGTISGTVDGSTEIPTLESITATFTDQYGRTIVGTYAVNTVYRTQATAANGLGPYIFVKDQAISAIDATADFTTNGNTLTYADLGLPSGLSFNVSNEIVGTPDTILGDDDYIIRATDEYGRATDSTISIQVVETGTITLSTATYTRGSAGVSPSLAVTRISTSNTTGPYYLDVLTVTNGTTPSQTDMDNGSGTGVLEKLTLGPQADIANLDGDLDLSVSVTNGRIYIQYRDSAGNLSALTSVATADSITYDAVAPAFSSAEVGNVDATSLIVTFSKAIYGSSTAADWDVQVAGAGATESAVSFTPGGTTLDITLGAAVTSGQAVTVAYNGTGLIGIDAEQMATFTAQSVTNNVSGGAAITDDFNRADEDVSANANWSVLWNPDSNEQDIGVVSNQVAAQTGTPRAAFKHGTSVGSSDQYAQIDFVSGSGSNNFASLYVRAADTSNYYEARFTNSGKAIIYKTVSGSETLLANVTGTALSGGEVLRLEAEGTALRAKVDGVTISSATDSDLSGDGVGFGRNNDIIVDNFEADSI